MGLESSRGEKTLYVLNVDDLLLDRGDWGGQKGRERQKGGIGVGSREKYRGETHLNHRSPYRPNATSKKPGGKSRLKSAHPALKTERRSNARLRQHPPRLMDSS